jgi:hypothetical protein
MMMMTPMENVEEKAFEEELSRCKLKFCEAGAIN